METNLFDKFGQMEETGFSYDAIWHFKVLGAVHKVRHARGGWGPKMCDSLWQGEGVKGMWRHAYKFFYHTYDTWNLKWCLTFCCSRCIL